MGLFDFASNIGKKIFGDEAEASEKVQQHLEENNPGVEGLTVEVVDGVANIKGEAKDQAAMEKAVLMAGNIKGVSSVNADALNAPEATQQVEYYEIASGDTLSGISKQFYGDANRYNEIFEANKEVIQDANLIFVGQKIRIPQDAA